MATPAQQLRGPGFVAAFFDIPFPISIPNGAYLTYDPRKEVACVEVRLGEGSRAFFRNRPIVGPTSFQQLRSARQEQERPREGRSYVQTCVLRGGEEKATLNIYSGTDGGYAECKYYSEVCVTFLVDDLQMVSEHEQVMNRVSEILNPFLDKYKLLNGDYRVSRVSHERNFYFATCHTSPLTEDEAHLNPRDLFERLKTPRTFLTELGHGASNVLRTNSFELLGPRSSLAGQVLVYFGNFIQEEYEISLSYDLIMEALRYLQKFREYRLAIVHAETAFEVYVSDRLIRLMVGSGMSQAAASTALENEREYWGVKNKIRRLDERIQGYCANNNLPFTAFVGSALYDSWESDLYQKRNDAVHAGTNAFSYDEASAAVGIAKECIVILESRIPGMSDRVQLNPSMSGFRQNSGEVMF